MGSSAELLILMSCITAILCDIGEERLFYVEALCQAIGLNEHQRQIVNVYAALFAGSFIGYCSENGDEEAGE